MLPVPPPDASGPRAAESAGPAVAYGCAWAVQPHPAAPPRAPSTGTCPGRRPSTCARTPPARIRSASQPAPLPAARNSRRPPPPSQALVRPPLRNRLPAPASRPLPRSAAMAANPAQPTIARRVWFQAEPAARPLRPVPLPLRPARSCARAHTASQRQEPAARRLAAACSAPPANAARPLRQDPADPLETLTRSGWPPSPRLTLPAPADSAFLDRACKLFVNAYSPRFHSCQWDVGSR